LQWMHTCSAGTDRPIFAELASRGVMITSSSGANAKSVAHSALAGMLALARNIPSWVTDQQARLWKPRRHQYAPADIDGTTVVIIGLGAIGREIAKLCKA